MKIVFGVTGASGAIYGWQILNYLKNHTDFEVHIVVSDNGHRIIKEELELSYDSIGYPVHSNKTFDVPFVSGSSAFDLMVVAPCSMGTLGRIAHGVSDDTLTRTADVFLKEKKKIILVPRETPLSLIHIENMRLLACAGVDLIPAIPSFYSRPQTVDECAFTVSSRVLDHMGIAVGGIKRWMDK